jgi:hypothetical protein
MGFQAQNYGRDFNEAFTGMGNFLTGQQKAADDREQRLVENDRAERTLKSHEAQSAAAVEHSNAQTNKIKREEAAATLLQEAVPVYSKIANGEEVNDDDVKVMAKMRVNYPSLTNNPDNATQEIQDHQRLIKAAEWAKSMPASDKPFSFEYGENPETDAVLDALNRVNSPARFKTFVDKDGSVTGIPGSEYATDRVQAGAVISGDGQASTAVRFSIVDGNGNPIYEKDQAGNPVYKTDAAGKPVLDANGNPVPKLKLVASSIGETNDPNSRVNFVPADAQIMKSKLALEQLQAETKLTPDQRAKLKKEIETGMYGLIPNGAEKLLASQVKDNTPIALADGGMLVGRDGKILVENPKAPARGEHMKSEEGVKGRPGWVQDVYTDGNGKEIRRGEPRLQFNPRQERTGKSDKEMERESRADIDKSVAEYNKRRADVNKRLREAKSAGETDFSQIKEDLEQLKSESEAITVKMANHKKDFGRDYTPTAATAPAPKQGGGMATPPAANQPAVKQAAAPQPKAPAGMYARNPQTKQRIVSYDGGKSWQPAQ